MKKLLLSIFLAIICLTLITQVSSFTCPTSPRNFYPNPDADKCDTFYQCSNGVATLLHCPWPLVFHADVNGCTRPTADDCISPDPICPTDVIQASPADCSKFYLCSFGVSTLMSCAEGTVFNKKGYCD